MSPRLNLLSPEVRANPYPHYAELRRQSPVCQVDPGNMWVVSRYDDIHTVLRNPQLFSSEAIRTPGQDWFESNPMMESMLLTDPPRHGRLRGLVHRSFGPEMLARLEPRIRAIAEALTREVLQRRAVDFVESFALPLPATVIAMLLGLDVSLHDRFKHWADAVLDAPASGQQDPERRARTRAQIQEMEGYLRQVVEERRRHPAEDLVSELLHSRVDGEALEDREVIAFLTLLLVAGLETTVHLLSGSAGVLADHPDVLERLHQDSTLIPRFLEEVLRYEPPVHGVPRMTREEVTVGGVLIPKGARVLVLLGSANRDEAHFPEPDRFLMERPGHALMSFGHGIHFCLGAPLARLEAKLALEVLLPRCARLRRGAGPIVWNMALTARGPMRLPMELEPA